MKITKKWLCIFYCMLMGIPAVAFSQALPVAQPKRINSAISHTMSDVMIDRGVAANDAIFAKTLSRLSPALSSAGATGAAITVGAVTAPGWVSAALMIGIGMAVQYAIELAIDASVKWFFQTDGTIDYQASSDEKNATDAIKPGTPVWVGPYYQKNEGNFEDFGVWGSDIEIIKRISWATYLNFSVGFGPEPECDWISGGETLFCGEDVYIYWDRNGPPKECPQGEVYLGTTEACVSPSLLLPESDKPLVKAASPQEAIDALPESVLNKNLHPRIIAALVNQAWKTAAEQADYDGLPYSNTSPVTADDVSRSVQKNPQTAPTVRDFVSPNPESAANPTPWVVPTNPAAPRPDPETSDTSADQSKEKTEIDFGPDPGIDAPTLETPPTAQQIIQPILDVAPGLRNFQISAHSGACPRPSFVFFEKTYTFDAHCELIDENKSVMQAAMGFAWAALALFIILSA